MALHLTQRLFNCDVRDGGFAVLEPPELSTQAVVLVAPPCFDASDGDAMEEDWLDDQLQESLGIDHAEATMTVEPTCEPKLLIGRFGCISGDHTVPHAEHISLLRAAQHATRFWKDDGSVRLSTCGGQLVEGKAVLLRGSTLVRRHLETGLFNVRQEIRFLVAGAEGGGSPVAG